MDYIERSYTFRSKGSSDGRTISGYVAVFGQAAEIRGEGAPFTETIRKGSFSRAIDGTDPMPLMMYAHGHDGYVGTLPVGRWDTVREDDTGLYMEGRLFDTPRVNEVREAIANSGISGASFRFEILDEKWNSGQTEREIRSVKCIEAGPVAMPAYRGTLVGVRSTSTRLLSKGERARVLRELELARIDAALGAVAKPGVPKAAPGDAAAPPSYEEAAAAIHVLAAFVEEYAKQQQDGSPMPPAN